jgi:hypothetical protein
MATEVNIGDSATDLVFLDTDWTKAFKVADLDTDESGATAKDITGWALTFDIRPTRSSSTVLLTKSVGSGVTISGVFNSVLATSTQVATITVTDTDMATSVFGRSGGVFHYSLKRTDNGFEAILAYGTIRVKRATQA